MYPDFRYLLHGIFGIEVPEWLGLFKTFGFLVALSFMGAAWATSEELKRKERQGLLQPEIQTIVVGKPMTMLELFIASFIGFLAGYKIGGVYGHYAQVSPDPLGYLLSVQGNFMAGLVGAAIFGVSKYFEKKKQELPEPLTKKITVHPYQLITEIVMIAAIGGLVGAKLFNALETWDDFIKNPIESLTSSSGLTFLGGLIVATISFYFYARKHGIPFKHLCDATAPGIMLAYGLGRLGCQLSGDGDWGIFNAAYITNPDGSLRESTAADMPRAVQLMGTTPHANIAAPSWLPDWMFGMNYPHNVGHEGFPIQGCVSEYCNVLPVSVFPTPIYEAIVCVLLFALLWTLRKKFTRPLQMFGTYLILVGVERFTVELIRVNYKYDWGFIHPSQAEILSVVLVLLGLGLLFLYKDKDTPAKNNTVADAML